MHIYDWIKNVIRTYQHMQLCIQCWTKTDHTNFQLFKTKIRSILEISAGVFNTSFSGTNFMCCCFFLSSIRFKYELTIFLFDRSRQRAWYIRARVKSQIKSTKKQKKKKKKKEAGRPSSTMKENTEPSSLFPFVIIIKSTGFNNISFLFAVWHFDRHRIDSGVEPTRQRAYFYYLNTTTYTILSHVK